jgi:hypothetical protein
MADTGSILGAAGDIGQLLAQIERQRAAGRQAAGTANQAQDRIALERTGLGTQQAQLANQFGLGKYGLDLATTTAKNSFRLNRIDAANTLNNMDLAQRKFQLAAPGARATNAVRGDILANAQDATLSGVPSTITVPAVSGGLRPSMFSGATRALGGEMSTQAEAGQRAGDSFAALPGLPDYSAPTTPLPTYREPPPLPTLTPLPAAGKLDTGLGLAGTLGSLAGAGAGGGSSSSGGNIIDAAKSLYNLFKGRGSEQTPINPQDIDPSTGLPYDPRFDENGDYIGPSGASNLDYGDTQKPTLDPAAYEELLRQLEEQYGAGAGGRDQSDYWDQGWGE